MITCVVDYELDTTKLDAFERYAQRWIQAVTRLGGVHHGYFLPSEGRSDRAVALFSFENLTTYEAYRAAAKTDAECVAILKQEQIDRSIIRYDRSFFRPLLPPALNQ